MVPLEHKRPYRNLIIHVLCWSIVLFFPLVFSASGGDSRTVNMWRFVRGLGNPLASMMLFYLNYCVLVPHLLSGKKNGKKQYFYLINIVAITLAFVFSHQWWVAVDRILPHIQPRHSHPQRFPFFLFYNALQQVLLVGLSVAVRMTQRWQRAEKARTEAERSRTEAELRSLHYQLNPHFLLNTLNNIYALIAFDTAKAQQAVDDLSRLLRHVLYECRADFVPLCKEVDFMRNYIELMHIRCSKAVDLRVDIDVADNDNTPVPPLLLICLVENAFKHGISPTGSGFIHINLNQHDNIINCHISNSNHPKTHTDKSGSGIGLEQVERRLELLYPNKYTWNKGTRNNDTEYFSHITLQPL